GACSNSSQATCPKAHDYYTSCVTRITSSGVVTPASTFFHPSSLRVCIPALSAALLNTLASGLVTINVRIVSSISSNSKIPIRLSNPVCAQCSHPAPRCILTNPSELSSRTAAGTTSGCLQCLQLTRTNLFARTPISDDASR